MIYSDCTGSGAEQHSIHYTLLSVPTTDCEGAGPQHAGWPQTTQPVTGIDTWVGNGKYTSECMGKVCQVALTQL
ncbi:hypothetical protein [Prevotella denticola]|uniref:hypothetical protein n=1 Tax=Prevotella denticola TaxID=28129 RepID=UPI001C607E36|nr:hypothetical protein [Prevotella denticola]MBW4760392.1 hypothetical protein [Prevotella denticola]